MTAEVQPELEVTLKTGAIRTPLPLRLGMVVDERQSRLAKMQMESGWAEGPARPSSPTVTRCRGRGLRPLTVEPTWATENCN